MNIGRRIYYDKATGNVIQDIVERSGDVTETTVEQDFESYVVLSERVPETVGYIELEHGLYAADLNQAMGQYKLNQINESFDVDMSGIYNEEADETTLKVTDPEYSYGCNYEECVVNKLSVDISSVDRYGNVTVSGEVTSATLSGTKTIKILFNDSQPGTNQPPVYVESLSTQVTRLKAENEDLRTRLSDIELYITTEL